MPGVVAVWVLLVTAWDGNQPVQQVEVFSNQQDCVDTGEAIMAGLTEQNYRDAAYRCNLKQIYGFYDGKPPPKDLSAE